MEAIPNLIVVGSLLGLAYYGYKYKLFDALMLFFRLVVAFVLCMTFYEPVGELVQIVWSGSKESVNAIGFALVFLVAFMLTRQLAIQFLSDEEVYFHKALDNAGGIIFGLLSGIVAAGLALVGWGLVPASVSSSMPIDHDAMWLSDFGEIMIAKYAKLSEKTNGGKKFPLDEFMNSYKSSVKVPNKPSKGKTPQKEEMIKKGGQIDRGLKAMRGDNLKDIEGK